MHRPPRPAYDRLAAPLRQVSQSLHHDLLRAEQLRKHRYQALISAFAEVIIIRIQRLPIHTTKTHSTVAEERQRVENSRPTLRDSLILQRQNKSLAQPILLQGYRYIPRAPKQQCSAYGAWNIHRHLGNGPQQIHRVRLGYGTNIRQVTLAELLNKGWHGRSVRLGKIHRGLAGNIIFLARHAAKGRDCQTIEQNHRDPRMGRTERSRHPLIKRLASKIPARRCTRSRQNQTTIGRTK